MYNDAESYLIYRKEKVKKIKDYLESNLNPIPHTVSIYSSSVYRLIFYVYWKYVR